MTGSEQVAKEGRSRSAGVSPTGIISGQSRLGESGISPTGVISGQSSLMGGGYSPTGITTGSAPSNDDNPEVDKLKKKTKNAS